MSSHPLLFQTLTSGLDRSVNHVARTPDGGAWEARFVQRVDDYFICYVSSHTGCNQSCRFCHLTATGQTTMGPADVSTYLAQVDRVMGTYRERREQGLVAARKVHFNFMARGEPLANPLFLADSQAVFDGMAERAAEFDLAPRYKVSSILPRDFTGDLAQVLADPNAEIYYSLYSMNPAFRKRWVPKAMPPEVALDLLADYQQRTGKRVVLHWAMIAGQNDSEKDVAEVIEAVVSRGLRAKYNQVRYNPHDDRHGVEPTLEVLNARFAQIQEGLGFSGELGSRQVPRVGMDVQASCGMFDEQTA